MMNVKVAMDRKRVRVKVVKRRLMMMRIEVILNISQKRVPFMSMMIVQQMLMMLPNNQILLKMNQMPVNQYHVTAKYCHCKTKN